MSISDENIETKTDSEVLNTSSEVITNFEGKSDDLSTFSGNENSSLQFVSNENPEEAICAEETSKYW